MKKSVMIYGQRIKIIPKKGLLKSEGKYGYYDEIKKEIIIDADLPSKVEHETLLHEMGHALFHRAGLGQAGIEPLEELIVEQFSIMFSENFKTR